MTSNNICDQCEARPRATGLLCLPCYLAILADLDALAFSWRASAEPKSLSQTISDGGRSKEKSLPGGTEWISWREGSDIRHVFCSWISVIRAQEALNAPRDQSVEGLVAWVRTHIGAACKHSSIIQFSGDLGKLAAQGKRLDGSVGSKSQRIPCQIGACSGILTIQLSDLSAVAVCKVCSKAWTVPELMALARLSEAWVSEDAAAIVADCSGRTLRTYAKKGLVLRKNGKYWLPSVRNAAI